MKSTDENCNGFTTKQTVVNSVPCPSTETIMTDSNPTSVNYGVGNETLTTRPIPPVEIGPTHPNSAASSSTLAKTSPMLNPKHLMKSFRSLKLDLSQIRLLHRYYCFHRRATDVASSGISCNSWRLSIFHSG